MDKVLFEILNRLFEFRDSSEKVISFSVGLS